MVRWLAPLGLFLLWALTLYAYPHRPSTIPAHWNAQGEVIPPHPGLRQGGGPGKGLR
ncbi:DUF1648 domain-containing protein [Thermus caldifontis]|uniref:DUF1648 domain-containing protein n=1 Tax=Thermus caldifontis TaxID=1930763 RepID=UPI001F07E71D|nr:DUF1648 domain-containing protein [Thermus caldifontis]